MIRPQECSQYILKTIRLPFDFIRPSNMLWLLLAIKSLGYNYGGAVCKYLTQHFIKVMTAGMYGAQDKFNSDPGDK